jgi:phage shock protein B
MELTAVVVLGLVAIAAVFTVFVAPVWIIAHYLSKARATRKLTAQDERLLADLWETARRMEERMNNLERIEEPEQAGRSRERAHG